MLNLKLITQLGKQDENRSTPIKLRMYKIDHKDQITNSLSKLKQALEEFKSISVTEDCTLEERQAIKDKVMEAKNKTEKEGEGKYMWKGRDHSKKQDRVTQVRSEGNPRKPNDE